MSEAEINVLKARLRGGILSKAQQEQGWPMANRCLIWRNPWI
jgi:hypothetical protein